MTFSKTIFSALTFDERCASREQLPEVIETGLPIDGDSRWSSYRNLFNLTAKSNHWSAFLAEYVVSRTAFACLMDDAKQSVDGLAWTQDLEEVRSRLSGRRFKFDPRLSAAANLAFPVAKVAWQHFVHSGACRRDEIRPIVAASLRRCLLQRLSFAATQVAQSEQCKFLLTDKPNPTQLVLEYYPALARLWIAQCRHWSRFVQEVLDRASTFSKEFLDGKAIQEVKPDLSDLHEGNRAVTRVRFAKGESWYYKPRSGVHELIWFNLLRKINRNGFPTRFKVPRVISKDHHCWIESVSTRSCLNQSQVPRLFFRTGALLYLLYRLRGVDFHAENIVVDGENPVLIDCETLLHPDASSSEGTMEITEALARTGMLPTPNCELAQIQSGGGLVQPGKTAMYDGSINYPVVANSTVAGFSAMHKFVSRKGGSKLLNETVSCLEGQATRYIHRPSMHYWMTLQQSLAPDMLRDGLKRSIFLHASCWNAPAKRRRREVSALQDADIPNFFDKASKLRRTPGSAELEQAYVFLRWVFS